MMLFVLRGMLVAAALAYIAIAAYMYLQQHNLQYFPSGKGLPPVQFGLDGVSVETILTPDGERIIAWYTAPQAGKPAILFFHGNGGEVSDRSERLAFYQSQGFGALFVSYRGYGGSTGQITEQGLVMDGLAAYDWLAAKGLRPEDITIVGESLGTGVAVQVAAQRSAAAVALEAPFAAAVDVAASIYWWLPVRLLMKDTFLSRDFIARLKAPLLIQHGAADLTIPVSQGEKLFELAPEPKELVVIADKGHEVIHEAAVWQRELKFFSRRMKAAQ